MNSFTKKLSALVLTTVFAAMQVSAAVDTGLGAGNGGAVINTTFGGYAGLDTGLNSATLKFQGDSHVVWDSLNVNAGETLNFNAINGATGVTVLNTVNNGMTNVYGSINANDGIGKLIISNPNGMLFDGAKFTTAGDALITTQALQGNFDVLTKKMEVSSKGLPITGAIVIKDNLQTGSSIFNVGGEVSFVGDNIQAIRSAFNGNKIKFTTTNGQDYQVNCCNYEKEPVTAVRLDAVEVNGDVYIVAKKGVVETASGGNFNGDLNITSKGAKVALNEEANGKALNITGDTNIDVNSQKLFIRNTKINGNLNATNSGGFVEIGNVTVNKDANLTTINQDNISDKKYNHFVHTIGDNVIKGDLNINSAQNIHIGGYYIDKDNPKTDNGDGTFFYNGKLADGSLTVGGNLNAKTESGHIMTTVNTTAKNINYEANSTNDGNRYYGGNILTDGKAVLTADTYQFKADGYIGGLKDSAKMSVDNQIINLMEGYQFIPAGIVEGEQLSHDYLTVNGGTITKIETPKVSPKGNDVQVYIKSLKDVTLNGANAGVINITAPKSRIDITGDVHAKEINVGYETDYLKLDFPNRDFTTNYTSIRDEKVVTIRPDEEITYDLADGGYNQPTLKPGEKTTYLIGPDKPKVPDKPTPDDPTPEKLKPTNDDNVRVRNWVPEDPMKAAINTPVAYAADLDDEEAAAVRKNVDGSVTVVRAFPMYE